MKRAVLGGAALALLAASAAAARPVRVDLDARLELAGAVDWLAAPKSSSAPDALAAYPYARELAGRLPAPSDPELVSSSPWSAAGRARLMLSLSPLPALESLDAAEDEGAGGRGATERRLAALRAYARASSFESVFNATRYLLDADAARVRRLLGAEDPVTALASYTGLSRPERIVVLVSPFAPAGPGPGLVRVRGDGSASLTLVLGPQISTAAPSGLDFRSGRLPQALWNDAAQLQLEPLFALYGDRVAQSSRLAGADDRCSRDWRRCLQDQLARAVTLRLTALRFGAPAAEALRGRLEGEARSPVLTALLGSLGRYEKARRGAKGRGAGLADGFPELLAALPLDDPAAAPKPPRLPDGGSLPPERRLRLAAFLKSVAPRTRDPRLKTLAAAAPAWARADASARPAPPPDDLRRKGIEDFGSGRAEAALADFQAALSSSPRDAQTLASEAAVLATLGRDDEALAAYDAALAAARSQGAPPRLASDLLSSREETRRRLDARKKRASGRP